MSSAARKHSSKSERSAYVGAWRASNLSQAAFARQKGLKEKTLNRWIKLLSGEEPALPKAQNKSSSSLLRVQDASTSSAAATSSKIEILLPSSIRLRLLTVSDTVNLLKGLKACS